MNPDSYCQEHKIFYKYNQAIPTSLIEELKSAADSAAALDQQMERLHIEIGKIKDEHNEATEDTWKKIIINNEQFTIHH